MICEEFVAYATQNILFGLNLQHSGGPNEKAAHKSQQLGNYEKYRHVACCKTEKAAKGALRVKEKRLGSRMVGQQQ